MYSADTIFALATPPGRSAVAVVRISGPQAAAALQQLGSALPAPRQAALMKLKDAAGVMLDDALVLYFPAPHSYTGEDVVELQLHGSRAVIRGVLETLTDIPGCRAAQAGEFTRRAFLNGKMDLTAAEGVMDLIDADTAAQRAQALRQLHGALAAFYDTLRRRIVALLAHMEAYIDFPDEEIPADIYARLRDDAAQLRADVAAQLDAQPAGERVREGIYAAIIGPPNAGKSSLLNALAGRDVAIVSAQAGTTRDVLEVELDLGGYALTLADTAGLREAEGSIEEEGIRRARARAREADFILAVFDATALPECDAQTTSLINARSVVVMNKMDVCPTKTLPLLCGHSPLPVSALCQEGLDALLERMKARIAELVPAASQSVITRLRHRQCLGECAGELKSFLAEPRLELACEHLRLAAQAVGKITGRIDVDELLDEIFRSFCIGK